MNTGKIIGELKQDYHASPAVGSHKLADFCISPLLYYRRYISHEAPLPEQTPALALGEYFHTLALEGEAVADARYVILPEDAPDKPTAKMRGAKKNSPASLERIQWWDTFLATAGNRIITSKEHHDLVWRMLEAIQAKPKTKAMFSRGTPEVTFRKKMASFAIQCRADWLDETPDERGRQLIVDVKTVESLLDFDFQFHKFGYYKQAAFYSLVVDATLDLEGNYPRFLFVVVEKGEPWQVAIREPDDIALEIGRNEVMRDLAQMKQCYDSGVFPGEPDEIRSVSLPDWKIVKSLE